MNVFYITVSRELFIFCPVIKNDGQEEQKTVIQMNHLVHVCIISPSTKEL